MQYTSTRTIERRSDRALRWTIRSVQRLGQALPVVAVIAPIPVLAAPAGGAGLGQSIATAAAVDRAAILARIADLRDLAEEDGFEVRQTSADDLLVFADEHAWVRKPAITLNEDGTLRAIWRDTAGQQVALHFRDDRKIQFVIFRLDEDGSVERVAGLVKPLRLAAQLGAFGMRELMKRS